ncbi:carbohydrate binding protein with CBM9 domain [Chitinophaga dinghuensis]|uniref:Carbohydrate binding protein with CBM9 domain n=1 Tax=Chitinophaga dinghuensis TaxID=1539050 RepID=A0A327W4A7_9BACT|nr:carbohydrate-binding family 9-like protein [Chitinophaga dinghuensis]RAJ85327.1 carbohydrate binding protein with CBM9 domain [Chitinophaga dinghuensis]
MYRCYWLLVLIMMGSLLPGNGVAQTFSAAFKPFAGTPRNYVCMRTMDSIRIDGHLDEDSWKAAAWSADFTDIEGSRMPAPNYRTRIKLLWDEKYLYIAAWLQEPHVWGTLKDHDAIIFHDNDFEVFIDPDGDTHQYFELEINALNTVMDLFMNKPYRNGGQAMLNWDTKGLLTAVSVNGTLNNPNDIDSSWTVEMAIPFSALRFFGDKDHPTDGNTWRINFSRVEWDTDIRDGKYVKRGNPEHNWVWSAQDIINMHAPERWGYLQFSDRKAHTNAPAFIMPAEEEVKQQLWLAYYAQQEYRAKNGRYATAASQLKLPAGKYPLQIEGISKQFTATIKVPSLQKSISINQEGKISSDKL